jgi:hypothetical protein
MFAAIRRFTIICIYITISPVICPAQSVTDTSTGKVQVITRTDSAHTRQALPDTIIQLPKKFEPNPKKAGLFSAIIPGLGQAYDRKYWKLPVIYAGAGAAYYFIKYNSDQYNIYRTAYYSRLENEQAGREPTDFFKDFYETDQLRSLKDEYKKWLDVTILITGLAYTAQIIDAVVYAHLKNFDVSRNISMRVSPVVQTNYAGLGLVVNFK